MKWRNKSLSYWLRVLHRDVGYLMVGVCLIYAVSGVPMDTISASTPFASNAFATSDKAINVFPSLWGLPLINKTFISLFVFLQR